MLLVCINTYEIGKLWEEVKRVNADKVLMVTTTPYETSKQIRKKNPQCPPTPRMHRVGVGQ